MNMYEINQIFEDIYPPDAALWCNENGKIIVELEPQNGKRIFQIQEIPSPLLEEIKVNKIAELKAKRTIYEESPVEYNNKLWDFNAKSRDRITAAITALEISDIESLEWTAYDDTSSTLTVIDLKGIIAAAALRGDNLHKKYRKLRDAVNVAETTEEVLIINWDNEL